MNTSMLHRAPRSRITGGRWTAMFKSLVNHPTVFGEPLTLNIQDCTLLLPPGLPNTRHLLSSSGLVSERLSGTSLRSWQFSEQSLMLNSWLKSSGFWGVDLLTAGLLGIWMFQETSPNPIFECFLLVYGLPFHQLDFIICMVKIFYFSGVYI